MRQHHFIFFGLTSWDSLPQREHALAAECARLGHQVDIIEIAPSMAGKAHAMLQRTFSPLARDRGFARRRQVENLRIHTPPLLPTGFRNSLTPYYDRAVFRRWFRSTFRGMDMNRAIGVVMLPLWWGRFLDRDFFQPRLLMYDIADAPEVQSRNARTLQRMTECERHIARDVDVITYSALEMGSDIESHFPQVRALFLPNAVSKEFLTSVQHQPRHRSNGLREIGYIGATSDRWFDAQLVRHVARAFPQHRFNIVGPAEPAVMAALGAESNVALHGFIPHEQLPAWLERFDLAIIPFQNNGITRVVNPLKLYEYAAAGLPVVATRTDELRHFIPLVELADTPQGFVSAMERALGDDSEEAHATRRRFAEENTWTERVLRLLSCIDEHVEVA